MKKLLLLLCALSVSFTVYGGINTKDLNKIVDTVTAVNKISVTVRDTIASEDTEELLNLLTEYAVNKGKAKVQNKVDDFINKKITGDREKALLREAFAKLGSEKMTAQDLTDVTLAFQTSALKNIINKNLGKHEAQLANEALDKLVTEGADGALNVGQTELNRLIDEYVKGDEAKASLKDTVQKIRDNKIDEIDVGKVSKDVAQGALNNWIDKQDWNDSQKKKAKEIVDAGLDNGVDGVTDYVKQKIVEKVGKELGEEAGNAMQNIIDQVTDYDPNKESIRDSASTIAHAAMVTAIEKQYDKICKKYPLLGKIMDHLGIKGDVLEAAAKIKQILQDAKSIKKAIFGIAGVAVDFFKTVAKKLFDAAKQFLKDLVNQLGKLAMKMLQKVIALMKEFVKEITQKIINEMINFAKKLAAKIAELTKKVIYVVNKAKSGVKMIIETVENIKEIMDGAVREKGSGNGNSAIQPGKVTIPDVTPILEHGPRIPTVPKPINSSQQKTEERVRQIENLVKSKI